MADLHCLYCERPLALLHRLTGDKEFCSKDHRRKYMKEHGDLALSRLLESQPKEPENIKRSGSILGLSMPDLRAEPPVVTTLPKTPPSQSGKSASGSKPSRVLTTPPPVEESKSQPPTLADFARGVVPPMRVSAEEIRQEFGPGAEPRWPKLPLSTPSDDGELTPGAFFVTSGAFLRRKVQPSIPADYWAERERDDDMIELPAEPPVWAVMEDRLRRTDRVGF